MESESKVQVIKQAIKQLMEEEEIGSDDDGRHRLLLSKLMAQLEEGESLNISRPEEEEERIVKELKKLKRQNVITQCLVSVMILLTVAWQISEVSIILKLKDGVSHPFRSIGSMLKSVVVKPRPPNNNTNASQEDAEASIASNLIESTPVHDLKMPPLKIDFPFTLTHSHSNSYSSPADSQNK